MLHSSITLAPSHSREAVCEESKPLHSVSGETGIQAQGRKTLSTYFSELLSFSPFALFFRKYKEMRVRS